MYDHKRYSSNTKKGRNFSRRKRTQDRVYDNNTCNDCFSFIYDKAIELEEKIEKNQISLGLDFFPCLYMGKEDLTGYIRDYFEFKDNRILKNALSYIANLPVGNMYDTITTNQLLFNTGNAVEDVYNSIMYRYQLETSQLISSEASIAFSFVYQFPKNIIPDHTFYNTVINNIISFQGFGDRTMFIRSDVYNNRILFVMSNITNNETYLEEYKECYNSYKKYSKQPILFTRYPDTLFNSLDNLIYNLYRDYMTKLTVNYKITKIKL